jgi:protoporphyrinogen IX oxidase
MSWATVLLAVHLIGNVVWIGSLLAVALLVAHAPWTAEPADVGRLARRVHLRLAVPGFLTTFAAGAARIWLMPAAYAHAYWLHAKLGLALLVIIFHHVIGGRARRVAAGHPEAAAGTDLMGIAAFLCAAGAVLLGIAKSLPSR